MGAGGGVSFFWGFFLEDKTSAPEIFSSCSFIHCPHFETSLVMVSCYGYEIWRHKSKIMQSAYACVIFHVKHKKLPFLAVLTWFLILGKIQDGGQDGDHCWWRHRPPAVPPPIKYTSSCLEDQRFSTKGKIVLKYCDIKKLRGGVSSTPPLLRSCTTVGVWVCVYVRELILYYPVFRTCTNFCTIVQQQNDSLVMILLCRHHKWGQMIFVPRKRTDNIT